MNLLRHHHQVDHNKKQTTLLDYNKYKTSEDRLDQMFSYNSFERKMIKWWKKLFLHLYDLTVVSAHIFNTKTNKKDFTGNFLPKKVAKGLLTGASAEMQVQVQTSSPAGRLGRRDAYTHTHTHIYMYIYDSSYTC